MLPFKRILFPVDFSEQTLGAARYAVALAGRFDAEVVLLHSVVPPEYNEPLLDMMPERKRERLNQYLVREFEYVRTDRVIMHGDPARAILQVASERHCDLIMMPTHGLGGFRRFLLGSVTAKILHDADCPVWTGAHLEQAPPLEKIEFHTFLCAVNTDSYAHKVLAAAAELAGEYRAKLRVVHVLEAFETAEATRFEVERAVHLVAPNAEITIEPGDIPPAISAEATRAKADLLIIGRGPAPGVFGRLRGHSYPIIRQSPCPVISV